jgi:hypothetical protein
MNDSRTLSRGNLSSGAADTGIGVQTLCKVDWATVAERSVMAQPTASAEDRFLALSALSFS